MFILIKHTKIKIVQKNKSFVIKNQSVSLPIYCNLILEHLQQKAVLGTQRHPKSFITKRIQKDRLSYYYENKIVN